MLKKLTDSWHKWRTASTNRRIFSGMLVVVAMTLMVKLMGAAKELVVAGYFGTGNMVDAFLFAFLLPSFAINVLSGSFISAMMPTYIRTRDSMGEKASQQLFSSVMALGVLFLVASTAVLAALAPTLLSLLGSGFSAQTMTLTHSLFYWLLPIVVITGIGHLYAAAMNAGERFAVVALAPAITPVCAVISLIFLADKWDIYALAGGTMLGAAIELLILVKAATHRGIPILPRWYGMTKELRVVIGQYAPMVAGAFLMSGTVLVDQSMAATLESGSVATLNYANKLVALILGIGSMALATAVLPHFSRMVASEDWVGVRHTFRTYARLIVFISIPITAVLFFFSEPITAMLFERGAFNAEDTHLVAQAQAFYLLQIPFYVLGILGVRLLSALAKNEILMKMAFVNLFVNIIGNYIFMQYLGVAGIALSTAVVHALSFGMIYYYLLWKGFRSFG